MDLGSEIEENRLRAESRQQRKAYFMDPLEGRAIYEPEILWGAPDILNILQFLLLLGSDFNCLFSSK